MNHHDAEMTDVVIVFDCKGKEPIEDAVRRLRELGMEVCEVNADEGVVEGNIDSTKVPELKTLPGVCYVRSVFSYVADYPPGDPRDKDGVEPASEDED